MRPILKTLAGMAFKKEAYLNKFEFQSSSVAIHLTKILLICDSDNEGHWIDEVDTIFDNLATYSCLVKVDKDEIKSAFVHYNPAEKKEWGMIKGYFKKSKNNEALIYTHGLKACELIPEIMCEFVDKMEDYPLLSSLTAFKDALKERKDDVKLITLSQLIKLKNRALK